MPRSCPQVQERWRWIRHNREQTVGDRQSQEGLTIGVTGHLKLNASARARVAHRVLAELPGLLGDALPQRLRILSGLAPGADLVLTHALIKVARSLKLPWQLCALLVAEPGEMIDQWLRRARELGEEPSAATQSEVRKLMDALLAQAGERQQLHADVDAGYSSFERLAAHLALESDLLLAVLRPAYLGKPGGTADVVAWRAHPRQIPEALRQGLPPQRADRAWVIDPDEIREGLTV